MNIITRSLRVGTQIFSKLPTAFAYGIFFFSCSSLASTKTVKIYLFEALAPRDTTSSQSFQNEFESTIQLAKVLTQEKLYKCGYKLETQTFLYDAGDSIQAFERAKQAEKEGAWLLIGPRRSNHYLLMTQAASETPSVSIMASSQEVEKLGPRHLSIYPSNRFLAESAALETKQFSKVLKPTYYSIVSQDCLTCKDFSNAYDQAAKKLGLTKLGHSDIVGDSPELGPILTEIKKLKPRFVLLPNYSKVSAYLMGAIHEKSQNIIFIGGDGWGDQKFGFVERNSYVEATTGITVRGFPPVETGLRQFPLGREAVSGSKRNQFVPSSGPGLALLRVFQGVTDLLCETKPTDITTFKTSFEKVGSSKFSSPWGINVYRVQNGSIHFWKSNKIIGRNSK